jgi:hypothetical protein
LKLAHAIQLVVPFGIAQGTPQTVLLTSGPGSKLQNSCFNPKFSEAISGLLFLGSFNFVEAAEATSVIFGNRIKCSGALQSTIIFNSIHKLVGPQARFGQHFLLTTHNSLFKSRADLLIIFLGYNNKKPAFSTIFAVII